MAVPVKKKYPLNPTLRWTDSDGRLTAEGFRIIRAIGEIIETITIEDGEVTAEKINVVNLEAISAVLGNVIIDGDLIVNGTITTPKYNDGSISASIVATSVGPVSLGGSFATIQTAVVTTDDGAVLLNSTANIWSSNAAPFDAYCEMRLLRNGSTVHTWIGGHIWASSGDTNKRFSRTYNYRDSSPGVGSVSYELQARVSNGSGAAYDISLVATNLKK